MRRALLLLLLTAFSSAAVAQTANFSASSTTGCPPTVIAFTDMSTGSPTGWSWDFGNGQTSTIQHPTTSYTAPGTYTVKLTVTKGTNSHTTTKTNYITINTPPVVSLSATGATSVCPGVPVPFGSSVTWNSPSAGTYVWDFGDGGTANTASPSHAYTAAGTYTVKVTAINSLGCPSTDTEVNLITVYQPPAALFTASDTAICSIGGTTTFTSTTTGAAPLAYTWDFGDGSPFGSSNPETHAYYAANSYSVKLIVTDARGCKDSLRRVNYIRLRTITAAANVPGVACQSSTITVNSTSGTTPGAVQDWDFGDGTPLKNGATVTHFYSTAGTYTIKLLATVGGCTDTDAHTIIINPRPNTSFSYSPPNPCPSPVSVTFTNNTSLSGSTFWSFGDGFTSTSSSPTHTYTWDSSFVVKLTVTTPAGCSDFMVDTVRVIPARLQIVDKNNINSFKFEGCFPYTANFHDTTYRPWPPAPGYPPYPFSTVSRTWDFGDGSATSSVYQPSHTYANPGTYPCTLITTTSNGCTFYDTVYVHVGGPTSVNFYTLQNPACAGSSVTFNDSSFSQYGPITSWAWDFGDKTFGIGNPTTTIYKKPGIYTVTLVVSQNGCLDSLTKTNYMTVLDPAAIAKYSVDCSMLGRVYFADSSIGATSILWRFGDGNTSTVKHPVHNYAQPGVYMASLIAWNSNTGCKDSFAFPVIINDLSLGIKASDSNICKEDTLMLIPVITGAAHPLLSIGEIAWNWNQGASAPPCCNFATSKGEMFIGFIRGRYNVTLSVKDNNGCIVNKTEMNFLTVGGPQAKFKATPPIGCAPATISLTDTTIYAAGTSPSSIYWDFGDGTSATTGSSSITHVYANVGLYGIKVIVTDNIGCKDSLSLTNYLSITRPTAFFGVLGNTACVGAPYTFFSSSTGKNITHHWDFGDGGTSNQTSPSHVYTAAGSYLVRLVVIDANGCKDTAYSAAPVTVSPRPSSGFTMDDTINVCPPLIVNFTNTSAGAVSYNWNFGNGASSTLTNPTVTYSAPGIYTIQLVAVNSVGCKDTSYGRARVLGYKGVLSYAPLKGCAPLRVHFQANNVPGVAGFIYDFGDGNTAATTATSVTHVYTKAGPHVPKVIMTDNLGCSATSVGLDTVKVDGVIAGFTFSPFPACDKGTIQFIDTSRGSYSQLNPVIWKFHDGTVSTLANPSMTYPGPGRYPVILYGSTVTGCRDTFTRNVVFHKLPNINAGSDTTICVSDSAMLRPRGGVSYAWTPGNSLSCANCPNPYASPSVPTSYAVVGTDTNGCTNRDTVTVNLKYKTVTEVTGGGKICSGDTVQFVAGGEATSYRWTPATGLSDPNGREPFAYPMTTQHYMLVSRLAGCIPDTDYVNLIVHPTPSVDAGQGATMIAGNSVQLSATGSGIITQWLWTPSEGIWSPTQPNTEAMPKRTTIYKITATTEYGCSASDTLTVVVLCDNSQVFLPNTFTPDGNSVNDVFYPRGRGLANIDRFRIYNRWGEVVFERQNIAVDDRNNGWDGKKSGTVLSPDIYVYTIEATCDTGEPIKWQGDVMLLR